MCKDHNHPDMSSWESRLHPEDVALIHRIMGDDRDDHETESPYVDVIDYALIEGDDFQIIGMPKWREFPYVWSSDCIVLILKNCPFDRTELSNLAWIDLKYSVDTFDDHTMVLYYAPMDNSKLSWEDISRYDWTRKINRLNLANRDVYNQLVSPILASERDRESIVGAWD